MWCQILRRWWFFAGSYTSSACSKICAYISMQTPSLIVQNALPLFNYILVYYLKKPILLYLAFLWANCSLFAWALLAYLSDPLALLSICITHTGLKMLSLVYLLLLYSTTSNCCKDLITWKTLYFLVNPLGLYVMEKKRISLTIILLRAW